MLENTPESAYWVGFIAADGSIINRRMKICLNIRDADHLELFAKYVGVGTVRRYKDTVSWSHQSDVVADIAERFDFRQKKTYNPPQKLPYDDKDMLISYLAGFIDGDGTIQYQTNRKTSKITTVSHATWFEFLSLLSGKTGFGYVGFRKDSRYVEIRGFRHYENVALKKLLRELGVPLLARKWSKIDETYNSGYGTKKVEVLKMKSLGLSQKETAFATGATWGFVSMVYRGKR